MKPDRRSFMTSAAAGFVWLATYRLPAAENLGELSFGIVSDTHLGRGDNQSAEKQWRQAIAEINAAPPKFILHLGDVVDGGRAAQYPIYAATRKELKVPIHEVPGNHDPDDLFEKHICTPIDRVFDEGGIRFVLFGNARTDSHLGFIRPEQIAWLDKQCSEAASRDLRIVVCCHVPIHSNLHPDRGWHVKPADGQDAFYELVTRYGSRILACFHGHFHNGIRGWRDRGQLVEAVLPSVCYNQSRGLETHLKEGTAKGFFVEELHPGYVLATLGKGRLTLRYKPLGHDPHGEYAADWA